MTKAIAEKFLGRLEKAANASIHIEFVKGIYSKGKGGQILSEETPFIKMYPSTILLLLEDRKRLIEALVFFAEPFTWSRVWADAEASQIGSGALDKMYGDEARKALNESWERIAKLGSEK